MGLSADRRSCGSTESQSFNDHDTYIIALDDRPKAFIARPRSMKEYVQRHKVRNSCKEDISRREVNTGNEMCLLERTGKYGSKKSKVHNTALETLGQVPGRRRWRLHGGN